MLKRNLIELNDQNSMFQLFFLINNENQDFEVVEVGEIDFTEMMRRLAKGESVLIARKIKQKVESMLVANEELVDDPWYFTHL